MPTYNITTTMTTQTTYSDVEVTADDETEAKQRVEEMIDDDELTADDGGISTEYDHKVISTKDDEEPTAA
jgi:hypothetical protein